MKVAVALCMLLCLSGAALGQFEHLKNFNLNHPFDFGEPIAQREPLKKGMFPLRQDTVTTQFGDVVGAVYDTATAFYAVPYATPPVGDLRFMPTVAYSGNYENGTLQATRYGPACSQLCALPQYTCPYAGYSEDCLTMNIYVPNENSSGEPLPVMFFIHGGNFVQGGDATILYNADYIANNTQAIVCTIQYRLGAFGFFLNDEAPGNMGIMDQTMALQWVQDNIASFGGDPTKVTIFGQSAGGASVAIHMINPHSKGLFSGAIMESNPITLSPNVPSVMTSLSQNMAANISCSYDDLDCLQAADVLDILNAQNAAIELYPAHILSAFMPWQPYIDGDWVPQEPYLAFTSGNYDTDVPFVVGTVNAEALMFIWEAFPDPVPYDEYLIILGAIFTTAAPKVIAEYPVPPNQMNDTRAVISVMGTDYIWVCPTRSAMRAMANGVDTPLYSYHFNHSFTNFDPWGPGYEECVGHVCHGAELPFVFNSAEIANFYTGYVWSAAEAVLANVVSTMWGNFAWSQNPNGPFDTGLDFEWGTFSEANDQDIQFATPSFLESGYRSDKCDFFDSLTNKDGLAYQWGV